MVGKNERGDTGDAVMILILLIGVCWVGATFVRYAYDDEIKFYHKSYEPAYTECISELPRSKDCEYVSMKFKIVSKK